MNPITAVWPGRPYPRGANWDGEGVNFALFSEHAERVELCVFDDAGRRQVQRVELRERTDQVFHCYLPEARPGMLYGYRVHGPYKPEEGHRFNPHKLLLDPYARNIVGAMRWSDALFGYTIGSRREDLGMDRRDSARGMPKCKVIDPAFTWADDRSPQIPWHDMVVYETHVRGFTKRHPEVPPALRGTYAGLASTPAIEYLKRLGVTTVELMPVHAFVDDRHLLERGLHNYWGYNTIGFFAPEARYSASGKVNEFKTMVKTLHSAGIEVILDVVYNHTAEGSQLGPTLCFRGVDNASYYRLVQGDRRHYMDYTGCGNTLNMQHPRVLQLIMDSLRYWVTEMHVDGFRFDLAAVLGRTPSGFETESAFFAALLRDPVLARVKLIAEPWDVGPGGYQLGAFPPPFMEWNDRFRDRVRQFWRGDAGSAAGLADRLTGSALQFDHSGRPATSSVNFVSAHDGFTLQDIVSYSRKHNEANGEDGRDGHNDNHSDNMGVEGPTEDAEILSARARRKRNMIATLLLSQGTPMILAGDELGNSQNGNNNAYCQDNETSWIDWNRTDPQFFDFVRRMIAFRKEHPILRQRRFLHSRARATDRKEDLFWRRADGSPMTEADWIDPGLKLVAVEIRSASGSPPYAALEYTLFAVFNAGDNTNVRLPNAPEGQSWCARIDTGVPVFEKRDLATDLVQVAADSICVFELEAAR